MRAEEELRKATRQDGNALYEEMPAGSWDAGFFETGTWISSNSPNRLTIDLRADGSVDVDFVVRYVAPPGDR